MHNITSPAVGELKWAMSRTLAPLSPTIPVGVFVGLGVGGHPVVTNDGALWIKLPKFGEVKIKKRSSRLNVHLMFPLFPANQKVIP